MVAIRDVQNGTTVTFLNSTQGVDLSPNTDAMVVPAAIAKQQRPTVA